MTPVEFLAALTCGCEQSKHVARDMCQRHYDAWRNATPLSERAPSPRHQRTFWDLVDKSAGAEECWIWTGSTTGNGYGFWSGQGVRMLAHRYSLTQAAGPSELFACHHCDNPPCVNPSHLYWGSRSDNVRDFLDRSPLSTRGTQKAACKRGHALTGDNVRIAGARRVRMCRICDNERSRLKMDKRRRDAGIPRRGVAS